MIRLKIWLIWFVARFGCWRVCGKRNAMHPLVIRPMYGENGEDLNCACGDQHGQYVEWRDRDQVWLEDAPIWVSVHGGQTGEVKLVHRYRLPGMTTLDPLSLWLCWIRHKWLKSAPTHHWISAGGELRAYDAGMSSCSKQCRRCGVFKRLDDCETVPVTYTGVDALLGAQVFRAEQQRMFVESQPTPPVGMRRIKA